MGFWPTVLMVCGISLVVGLALSRRPQHEREQDEPGLAGQPYGDAIDPNSVEALARYGTPATVADLVAQGRADDLQGLGYRGDLQQS